MQRVICEYSLHRCVNLVELLSSLFCRRQNREGDQCLRQWWWVVLLPLFFSSIEKPVAERSVCNLLLCFQGTVACLENSRATWYSVYWVDNTGNDCVWLNILPFFSFVQCFLSMFPLRVNFSLKTAPLHGFLGCRFHKISRTYFTHQIMAIKLNNVVTEIRAE